MTIEEIRELIEVVTETGVAELEVQRGENRVRIVRAPSPGCSARRGAGGDLSACRPTAQTSGQRRRRRAPAPAPAPAMDPPWWPSSPPSSAPFMKPRRPARRRSSRSATRCRSGQVLCIIESMKLMNEIEAEIAGVIVSKLVANAQPVEYGEALFTIRLA